MGKFRSRAKYIEAHKLTSTNVKEVTHWCGGIEVQELPLEEEGRTLVGVNIPTLNGTMRASEGDYIVRDENRHFSKMSADEFEAKYVGF